MATTKRKRGWKTDRMLVLKMICPDAVRGIALHGWQAHSFDSAVCNFFDMPVGIHSFEALRPVAREIMMHSGRVITDYPSLAGMWGSMAMQIKQALQGEANEVSVPDL